MSCRECRSIFVDTFATDISHEINQPLLLVRGYAQEIAALGPLNDAQRAALAELISGADRAAAVASALRELARISKERTSA